jgi:hypothetical protein
MTRRQVIEEAGFEALQRLDDIALRDAGPCRPVVCFLPGLSNGLRFPFDLTDLRMLDDALFEAKSMRSTRAWQLRSRVPQ